MRDSPFPGNFLLIITSFFSLSSGSLGLWVGRWAGEGREREMGTEGIVCSRGISAEDHKSIVIARPASQPPKPGRKERKRRKREIGFSGITVRRTYCGYSSSYTRPFYKGLAWLPCTKLREMSETIARVHFAAARGRHNFTQAAHFNQPNWPH